MFLEPPPAGEGLTPYWRVLVSLLRVLTHMPHVGEGSPLFRSSSLRGLSSSAVHPFEGQPLPSLPHSGALSMFLFPHPNAGEKASPSANH